MSAPASASALDSHLGFWMRLLSNHISERFRHEVEAHGVSVTEWVALRTLFDGRVGTHQTLIDALGMTKGAASKVVSRLEEKGLAERRGAGGDRRAQQLALTAAGRRLVPRLAALADGNDAHFFDVLPAAQRDALLTTLKQLVQAHGLKDVPLD
ncbi:MAG: winged helix-turn-helix transcriptional regulator [Proteobacteria bacterium]|nr:winged helix-turn-helix transcriptional regulator [Pseudomonadota bacterium]